MIDVMAAFVDVAGVKYPARFADEEILSLESVSQKLAFSGDPLNRMDALYFEHNLNCAIRDGNWKLLRKTVP